MRRATSSFPRARRAARLAAVLCGVGVGVGAICGSNGTYGSQPDVSSPTAQPVMGLPIREPTLFGASPQEAAGEIWAYATSGPGFQLVRYTPAGGWAIQPGPQDATGQQLSGFKPAAGPQAGRATSAGGLAIVGQDASGVAQLLVREPGGNAREAPALTVEPAEPSAGPGESSAGPGESSAGPGESSAGPGESSAGPGQHDAGQGEPNALLRPGETLSAASGEGVLMSAVSLEDSSTGVYLVPFESSPANAVEDVLVYDDAERQWSREPICVGEGAAASETCTKPAAGFKVLGIDASSPQNAWLLAKGSASGEGVVLLRREVKAKSARWTQQSLGGALGALFAKGQPSFGEAPGVNVTVKPLANGQPLTVTGQGLWVDGQLTVAGQSEPSSFTLFYQPGASGSGTGQVLASWCRVPPSAAALCSNGLESSLPSGPYRSYAWSEGGPYGQRVITGLGNGVSLSLNGTSFVRVLGDGGDTGTSAGAAFSSPQEGWMADARGGPVTHLTDQPEPDQLQSWPVPFRRPLTALAEQPGATPGALDAQAIAVGQSGQVARYVPGRGWSPEALLNSAGEAQAPDLRGVAWPEPERAYAVGTHGAMWLWQQSTGLWEPDPAKPPNLFLDNFTGIAFDPTNPARGYAIGQQGVLLGYGKSWSQEPLPPGLENADFTSIAFAGAEALVSYQIPHFHPEEGFGYGFSGGLLVNDGSGWRIDTEAVEMFHNGYPELVAGLPDGGAAVAGTGTVLERQGQGAPWQSAPAGTLEHEPVALAAFREGGRLHALVATGGGLAGGESRYTVDRAEEQSTQGQAPVVTQPFPLPNSGFLLRETPQGWHDEEHQNYPAPNHDSTPGPGETGVDWPAQPDAVLALALSPDGTQGWAVGGQTGEINNEGNSGSAVTRKVEAIQTAGVMRYPASGTAPTGFASAPEHSEAANATFAIGGGAQCATACSDLAQDQLGPDAWLANAIATARKTSGVRSFLYSGSHLAPGLAQAQDFGLAFQREEGRYAQLISTAAQGSGESLPVYAAPAASDLDSSGNLSAFAEAFQSLSAPQGSGAAPPGVTPTSATAPEASYFSFNSTGPAGTVHVIVLDYSAPSLGLKQQCWLAQQLEQASTAAVPAIVIGNRAVGGGAEVANAATDSAQVVPLLVNGTPPAGCSPGQHPGGASAYFFDYPEQNRKLTLSAAGASIPAFGSGTLGYVEPAEGGKTEFLGASGFLLAEVEVAKRNPLSNRAPVTARLVPDISDLALNASDGVLLRRSQATLFTALSRRPHAGLLCQKEGPSCQFDPDPYVPIPDPCLGPGCATGLFPAYTFTSSNPEVGDFVMPDPASPEGTTVLQGANGKPIPDQHSGLFCAYNAGTTTVTVQAGGLSSSEQVTVQAGSVEQPCGTVPLSNPPAATQQGTLPVPLPAPAPVHAAGAKPSLTPPPPPPAPAPVHAVHAHASPLLPLVPVPPVQLFPILPLVPAPAPAAARPTPPSGTAQVPAQSPVSQTVNVAEREEEPEGATESVHHMARYEPGSEPGPLPMWTLTAVLVVLAAGLGVRHRRPELARAVANREDDRRQHHV